MLCRLRQRKANPLIRTAGGVRQTRVCWRTEHARSALCRFSAPLLLRPLGRGFVKGGHDGQTANTLVCVEKSERCVLILSNDVRAEAGFAELVHRVLGDTGVPYHWQYGDRAGKS